MIGESLGAIPQIEDEEIIVGITELTSEQARIVRDQLIPPDDPKLANERYKKGLTDLVAGRRETDNCKFYILVTQLDYLVSSDISTPPSQARDVGSSALRLFSAQQ